MSIAEKIIRAKTDLDNAYEAGKQAEYNRFWDANQEYGTRQYYAYGFAGRGWKKETFPPKYAVDFPDTRAHYVFAYFNADSKEMLDYRTISHLFNWQNVALATGAFIDARIDYLELDMPNVTNLSSAFSESFYGGGRTHITLKITEKCTNLSSAFSSATRLTHLMFVEGSVIAASMDVGSCPLVAESLVSIVEHYSTTATGLTLTVKQTAVNNADWSKTAYASWDELKAIRPNLGFAYR